MDKLVVAVNFLASAWLSTTAKKKGQETPSGLKDLPKMSLESPLHASYGERIATTEEVLEKFFMATPEEKTPSSKACASGLVKKLFSPSEVKTVGIQVFSPNSVPPPFKYNGNSVANSPSDVLKPVYVPTVRTFLS